MYRNTVANMSKPTVSIRLFSYHIIESIYYHAFFSDATAPRRRYDFSSLSWQRRAGLEASGQRTNTTTTPGHCPSGPTLLSLVTNNRNPQPRRGQQRRSHPPLAHLHLMSQNLPCHRIGKTMQTST